MGVMYDHTTIYRHIEGLCQKAGCSITTMCRDLAIPRSTLSDLKAGRLKSLPVDKLKKIADYFQVSVEYLLGAPIQELSRHPNPDDRHPYLLNKKMEQGLTAQEEAELAQLSRMNRIAMYLDELSPAGQAEAEKRVKELTFVPAYQVQPGGRHKG